MSEQPTPPPLNDGGTVRCLRCDVPLEYSAERRLEDLTPFRLNAWFKVIVLECPSCGHIELFNPDRARSQKDEKQTDEPQADPRLIKLGILPGGDDLPPEDSEVAKGYEADADAFRHKPDEDMPIG